MTLKQMQEVLKIIERERKRDLKDQLMIQYLAARGEPEVVQKMLKS